MPRIDWVDVQRGDQKKSTNRRSSQRRRKDQSNIIEVNDYGLIGVGA